MKNKVLVVGQSAEKCKKLVEESISAKLEWSTENSFCKGSPYTLDTKYYQASIEFWVCDDTTVAFDELAPLVESLVFTFEPQLASSWDVVLHWFPFAAACGASNLVCVALSAAENLAKYQDWCIDNYVEFVDGSKKGRNEETRETLGVTRLYETLESVMWGNMQMKERPALRSVQPTGRKEEKKEAVAREEKEETSVPNGYAPLKQSKNDASPMDASSSLFAGMELTANEEDAFEDKLSVKEPKANSNGSNQQNQKPKPVNNLSFIDNLKDDMESTDFDFEKAMMEMMSLKQMASSLPFDQRKNLAAEVALRFSKLLMQEGEEDDLTVDDLLGDGLLDGLDEPL